MREYLIDTHCYLWFILDDKRLGKKARSTIEANSEIYLSIASLWEITIKSSLGKLKLNQDIEEILTTHVFQNDFTVLPIEPSHLSILHALPYIHGDPFDRMMIAQAISLKIPVIGYDSVFSSYGIQLIG
jgi:PIN domain nuclease of toxin-antitoxin system